ncbi:general secretion pathway protein GspB [Thermomonas sp. HDW16]|uniref:general secretion pathway protein GspB n=1 Tax=Thermomonas sp. HDW16 TaxID=2714945 RepID=UPI00140CB6D6|nr:general secretion pathway protein GspB [Thermomonas sp. HDW16]QIL21175.1 GspB domain-containing protein [Thermomonas sp. HDW16]
MSLILEALRKSEAERRRGSTPDVAMELPPVQAQRARATPEWLLPAVVLGAFVLLAAWWWSQRSTDAATNPEPVATSSRAEARAETTTQPAVVRRIQRQAVSMPATASPSVAAPVIMAPPSPPVIAEPAPPVRSLSTQPASPPPVDTRNVADIDATSIPPVKVSMHMWDESPTRRFVILDGQRMAEGDRNGEVTVIAIERDGVVVERNGQRARVPLP